MNNKIFIARHGQTKWNLENKVQGATDIPLTEQGIEQARNLGLKIKESGTKIDEILYSPLGRAADTARIVSEITGIPCKEEKRLIEQNFGHFEGHQYRLHPGVFHEAKKQFADSYQGGETMLKLAQRIYNLLDELKAASSGKTYLLITHGGIARMVHSYFYDMTNEEYSSFGIENCEIKEYQFKDL